MATSAYDRHATNYLRAVFSPIKYQGAFMGFLGDRITGVNPCAILFKDSSWVWTKENVVNDMVELATFFGDGNNRGMLYVLHANR